VVTQEDINNYIKRIPPAPDVVKETIKLLQMGELNKASLIAKEDRALSSYLKDLINKPIYGFSKEVNDVTQIFSILGVSKSLQSVYNYLLNLLSPKKWNFFELNQKLFQDFQAELSASWAKILKHLGVDDKEIEASITLIPASVIVCEALFSDHKDDVALIRSNKDIDLNTILERLSGYTLFDVCVMIAKKWEMDETIQHIVYASSAKDDIQNKELIVYAKWIHLLLFYVFSKPQFASTGLNDFIEFKIEFVEDIYEDFMQVMEIQE